MHMVGMNMHMVGMNMHMVGIDAKGVIYVIYSQS
jgi:hypothetical protein